MGERCRLCGATVRVADAAHVVLNAPDAAVADWYVCVDCFEGSVAPLFEGEAGAERANDEDADAAASD